MSADGPSGQDAGNYSGGVHNMPRHHETWSGVTFTYLAVRLDEHAALRMRSGATSPNMFAAGEIMAGNILGRGYLAGLGMTIGSVFGRIAGASAARAVRTSEVERV